MMRDTLKVTKENITLEYSGSTDDIKEIMLSIIKLQPTIRVPIKMESSKPISLIPIEGVKKQLPTKEEVLTYLATKPDFEHNNADLQEHFLGRRLNSRVDQKLYLNLFEIVKRAKKQIVKEHGGEWKVTGHIDFGIHSRISVFKLVKSDEPLIPDKPQIFKPIHLSEYQPKSKPEERDLETVAH